ncbi:MAG: hypothetical protein GY953_39350 [bacterium]|nr:hypothetical protein [bacterium]
MGQKFLDMHTPGKTPLFKLFSGDDDDDKPAPQAKKAAPVSSGLNSGITAPLKKDKKRPSLRLNV